MHSVHPSTFTRPLSSPSIYRPRQPGPEPEFASLPQQSDKAPPFTDRPDKHAHDCVSLLPAYLGNQVANPPAPGHSTHPSLDGYSRAHLWPASETSPLPPFTTFLRPNLKDGPAQHQNSLVPVLALVSILDVDSFPTSKPPFGI